MAPTSAKGRRARGHIRRRGGSFQVLVYAGTDPLTGKPNYLTESTPDEAQAHKILTRLLAQVDEQRNPRTKASMGAVLDAWLRTHEAEETTLDGYRGYVRRTIEPALGFPWRRSPRRCSRSSMPISGAAGTNAVTVSRPSTTAPRWSTSAGRSGTSAGPAARDEPAGRGQPARHHHSTGRRHRR